MILQVFLLLMLLGAIASIGMALKVAPVYTSLMSMAIWLIIGYSATSIDFVMDNGQLEAGAAAEPALSILAFGNALISLIIVVAAATGNYAPGDEHGTDQPYQPNEMMPR